MYTNLPILSSSIFIQIYELNFSFLIFFYISIFVRNNNFLPNLVVFLDRSRLPISCKTEIIYGNITVIYGITAEYNASAAAVLLEQDFSSCVSAFRNNFLVIKLLEVLVYSIIIKRNFNISKMIVVIYVNKGNCFLGNLGFGFGRRLGS